MISLAGAPVIETERLRLRAPVGADWAPYCAYATSERAAAIRGPETSKEAFDAFTRMIGQWVARGFGRFVIEERETGAAIGHVGPLAPEGHPEPELTWTLWSPENEGRGYAFEAAAAAKTHCESALGLTRMISLVATGNDRSAALARRLGAAAESETDFGWGPVWVFRHSAPSPLREDAA